MAVCTLTSAAVASSRPSRSAAASPCSWPISASALVSEERSDWTLACSSRTSSVRLVSARTTCGDGCNRLMGRMSVRRQEQTRRRGTEARLSQRAHTLQAMWMDECLLHKTMQAVSGSSEQRGRVQRRRHQ